MYVLEKETVIIVRMPSSKSYIDRHDSSLFKAWQMNQVIHFGIKLFQEVLQNNFG